MEHGQALFSHLLSSKVSVYWWIPLSVWSVSGCGDDYFNIDHVNIVVSMTIEQ